MEFEEQTIQLLKEKGQKRLTVLTKYNTEN